MDVSYFGAHGHVPLRVALLPAAVAGILLTALAGSAQIMQLRATARKQRRAPCQVRPFRPDVPENPVVASNKPSILGRAREAALRGGAGAGGPGRGRGGGRRAVRPGARRGPR
ncbi:lipopolysaccharide assembly protein LapA domain-containing protein, partial [Streptomyces sp. NPDC054804]